MQHSRIHFMLLNVCLGDVTHGHAGEGAVARTRAACERAQVYCFYRCSGERGNHGTRSNTF